MSAQQEMVDALGVTATRSLDSSHLAMLGHVDSLAAVLTDLAN
jgi:hypothetical protein